MEKLFKVLETRLALALGLVYQIRFKKSECTPCRNKPQVNHDNWIE